MDRPDAVGDLARGAAADPRWPRRRTTLMAFVAYLHERDGAGFEPEALNAAWREYEAANDAAAFNRPPKRLRPT